MNLRILGFLAISSFSSVIVAGRTWAQCELTAQPDPLFGTNVIAVAAEGDTLAAAFGPSPTFVRFYRRMPGGWAQEAELPAPGIAPTYLWISSMRTLAISGNRVIAVAATRNTDPASVFVREGSSRSLETTLSYPPTGFVAADISGDFAAVSTPVGLAGEVAAFVFERVDGVWTEHQRFICKHDGWYGGPIPRPISLGGDILALSDDDDCNVVPAGAPSLRPRAPAKAPNQSTPAQGRATIGAINEAASQALLSCSGQWWLVFRRTAEGWVDQTLASFGGNCHFSIDVHDGRIADAGTQLFGPNAVTIWDFDGAQWVVQQTIPLGDEPSHRRYPVLHLESDRLLVGIPGYSQPVSFAGSAKLFHWVGGSFSEVATIQSAAPAANDAFGFTVAFADRRYFRDGPGLPH